MRTPKRLIEGAQLTTGAVNYYQPIANTIATISAMAITNTTAAPARATVHLVPALGSVGDSNVVLDGRVISPGETYLVLGAIGQTLETGDSIQALADTATALTIVASGYEQS